jgi:tetratricopeptide (TPR) repeat protein
MASSKNYKFQKNLALIKLHLASNNIDKALSYLLIGEKLEPNNYAILNEIGACFAKKGLHEKALKYHIKASSLAPNNHIIVANTGLDLIKLERYHEGIEFLEKSIALTQKNSIAYIGLISAYHSLGNHQKVSETSLKGIAEFPEMAEFHGSLGVALIGLNKLEEAEYCIKTACILNPSLTESKLNLARIYSLKKEHYEAIKLYEEILYNESLPREGIITVCKYNLSYEYFQIGDLEKGWDYYDFGFDSNVSASQRRKPNRNFSVPRWNGDNIESKTLLVWAEQGLGDEIMFLSMLNDILRDVENIIIECDKRLVDIVKRSFPSVIARPAIFDANGNSKFNDFDFEIPIGSLGKYCRRNISDFKSSTYLLPSKNISNELENFFEINNKYIKIGICWRSGILNIERENNYIPLSNWGEIFKIPNAIFINLQYGNCEAELNKAEELYGVHIYRWDFIDLKNDLESVFSIINKLDVIVTAATAVSPMAYSIGKPTLTFMPTLGWTSFGTDYFPFSKHMIPFTSTKTDNFYSVLTKVANYIKGKFPKK